MAFAPTRQHTGHIGTSTVAEVNAFLAALAPLRRAEYIGCQFTITDPAYLAKGQDLWVVSASSTYPVKDVAEAAYVVSHQDTATVDLDVTGGVLTANVKLSEQVGNYAVKLADGIFVPTPVIPAD